MRERLLGRVRAPYAEHPPHPVPASRPSRCPPPLPSSPAPSPSSSLARVTQPSPPYLRSLVHSENKQVACVVGFPLGAATSESKAFETKQLVDVRLTVIPVTARCLFVWRYRSCRGPDACVDSIGAVITVGRGRNRHGGECGPFEGQGLLLRAVRHQGRRAGRLQVSLQKKNASSTNQQRPPPPISPRATNRTRLGLMDRMLW